MNLNPNFVQLGTAFATEYYRVYEQNRANVASLFAEQAFFTYENNQVTGRDAIQKTLMALTFQTIQHSITNIDSQPTYEGGALLVVTGQLKTDDDAPHSFTQVFCLRPDAGGNFLCTHSFFRLMLHNV